MDQVSEVAIEVLKSALRFALHVLALEADIAQSTLKTNSKILALEANILTLEADVAQAAHEVGAKVLTLEADVAQAAREIKPEVLSAASRRRKDVGNACAVILLRSLLFAPRVPAQITEAPGAGLDLRRDRRVIAEERWQRDGAAAACA